MNYQFCNGVSHSGKLIELGNQAGAHEAEFALEGGRVNEDVHNALFGDVSAGGMAIDGWTDDIAPHHAGFIAGFVALHSGADKDVMDNVAN